LRLALPPTLSSPSRLRPQRSDELRELIDSEFTEEGALQRALQLVVESGGIEAAQQLARQEADLALAALACLPEGQPKRSLQLMVEYVLERIY
jgi:all-trans-nonaprenyl-diphosphate synthase